MGNQDQHQWALGQAAGIPTSALDTSVIGNDTVEPSRGSRSWKWLLVGVNVCALLGGVAAAAFLWLMALPPAPECDKLTPLSPDIDRLSCAETAVQSGELDDLLTGLAMLETWTPDRPLYGEAQRLKDDWSEDLLYRARRNLREGDMDAARRLVQQIPASSAAYAEGQEIITQWDNLWKKGEAIAAEIQSAIKNQNWVAASDGIRQLEQVPHPYWQSEQSIAFSQKVWQERRARKLQQDALKQARSGQPADLAKALQVASQMNANTFARQDLQPILNQWSTTLLEMGRQQWKAGALDEAIALANQAKTNSALAKDADHLIRLSEARKLALATNAQWETNPKDIFQLQEAIAATQTIPSDSRFYAQAQDSLVSWQQQVDDLKRLQMAQLVANLGTIDTYRAAIAQAETIAPQRMRRRQAQTLAAHWRRQIERLEDRPVLIKASELAKPGTIPALREAIAEASQIPLGRALRGEAQAWVYQWTAQIQRIEDEPFLTLARTQARQGKLQDAIRTASVIQSGRFLYPSAQSSIRQWRGQIQRAEARRRAALLERQRAAEAAEAEAAASSVEKQPLLEDRAYEPPAPPARRRTVAPVEVPVERSPDPSPSPTSTASPPVQPLYAPLQPIPVPVEESSFTTPISAPAAPIPVSAEPPEAVVLST